MPLQHLQLQQRLRQAPEHLLQPRLLMLPPELPPSFRHVQLS
jgi:hypothetical protein